VGRGPEEHVAHPIVPSHQPEQRLHPFSAARASYVLTLVDLEKGSARRPRSPGSIPSRCGRDRAWSWPGRTRARYASPMARSGDRPREPGERPGPPRPEPEETSIGPESRPRCPLNSRARRATSCRPARGAAEGKGWSHVRAAHLRPRGGGPRRHRPGSRTGESRPCSAGPARPERHGTATWLPWSP